MVGAVSQTTPTPAEEVPRFATLYSAQHPNWPPYPGNGNNLPAWNLGDNVYLLDDLDFDYDAPVISSSSMMSADGMTPPGFDETGGGSEYTTSYSSSLVIDMNGLWLEITSVDMTNQLADLLLHNTSETNYYQLLSKTNLLQPDWILGTYKLGDTGTNQTAFYSETIGDNPMRFFRAQQAEAVLYVSSGTDAVEPRGSDPGQVGNFYVNGTWADYYGTNVLTVRYRMSGTASNGVDYTLLSGVATITNGSSTEIDVLPLTDSLLERAEDITLTLVPTNTYLIYPGQDSATIHILDSSTTVSLVVSAYSAIEPDGPTGIPATPASFLVRRTDTRGIYTNMPVRYMVSGTASNGVDYVALSGTVNFAPDMTETNIDITPLKDSLSEATETVTLTLLDNATNGYSIDTNSMAGTVTIDDSSTTVTLNAYSITGIEPDGPPGAPAVPTYFLVSRTDNRGIYTNLAVRYVMSGTASNGVDYAILSGTVNFAPDTTSTNIAITPLADSLIEGTETVTLTLLDNATNGYFLNTNYLTRTVMLNDSTTTVSLGLASTPGVEPDGPPGIPAMFASFWVHRGDARNIFTNLPVHYVVSGTASNGVDYVALSGTVNFLPGMTDTNIVITPLADYLIEGTETVTVTLLDAPGNGYFINTNSMTATIPIIDTTTSVSISAGANATEPYPGGNTPLQSGYFQVSRSDAWVYGRGVNTNLTVAYQMSGTASNGVDYVSLTGNVTFAPGMTTTNIYLQPLSDFLMESNETVTLTLIANPTNADSYLIASNAASATINIVDTTNMFAPVASLSGPIGIDFYAPSNALIVSYNFDGANPYAFARIYTNATGATVITNWSGIHGLANEIKVATVKTNAGGFTNGDVYFGSGTGIGWLSANGSVSNLNWCVLTNATVTNALPLRGSLYVDQTGVFSNNLIAVTSEGSGSSSKKGVWRVDAQGHPTLLTNLNTPHLEGVITLTNDVQRWGPWAGKIITGDEDAPPQGVIYTIATNGAVTAYNTTNLISGGIRPEDFDIIPANQDLYACDPTGNQIMKLPYQFLTNYVGDILITDAGESTNPNAGKLFIVHWNAATTNFVTVSIPFKRPNGTVGELEHVTFAPINLQPIP